MIHLGVTSRHVTTSQESGDFAEWHEQVHPSDSLVEGTVIGFYEGRVDTDTLNARILGVVSERRATALRVSLSRASTCHRLPSRHPRILILLARAVEGLLPPVPHSYHSGSSDSRGTATVLAECGARMR